MDELAAAVGEDGRTFGEARAVSLAFAGGEPFDVAVIPNDAPADLRIARVRRLRSGECRKAARRRKQGRERCPRKCLGTDGPAVGRSTDQPEPGLAVYGTGR
jgi:hypothetical protein